MSKRDGEPSGRECGVHVLGSSLFGPFEAEQGPGLAPPAELEFDDDRLRRLDRVTRLCLRGASLALEDGGLAAEDRARESCGLYLGNPYGAYEANLRHQRILLDQGPGFVSPAVFSNTLANVAAGWVTIVEALKGPLFTFAGGGLAGAEAVASAGSSIRAGSAECLLAGCAHAHDGDVHGVRERARGSRVGRISEGSAFLLLSRRDPSRAGAVLEGWGTARASGVPDPLERAVERALGRGGPPEGLVVAGDAARDGEARLRLEALGAGTTVVLSELHGDLGEAAPAAGAVLAARWVAGAWRPGDGGGPARTVLVSGLDPCARRAFALLFARSR